MSGLVKNFNTGIHSDTINVTNVKLCRMVPPSELYLFIPLPVTLTIFQDHSNVKVLPENSVFLFNEVETL